MGRCTSCKAACCFTGGWPANAPLGPCIPEYLGLSLSLSLQTPPPSAPHLRLPPHCSAQRGAATLSDLSLTTSSEALLSGKAPTFRLLVWAVEPNGEPVPYVTYVVSESFVVSARGEAFGGAMGGVTKGRAARLVGQGAWVRERSR